MAPIDPSEQRINALLQFSQNTGAAIEDVLAGLSNIIATFAIHRINTYKDSDES